MPRRRPLLSAALFAALMISRAVAHDFWIEPSSFYCKPGAPIKVALRVGEALKGEPVLRDPERFERFALLNAAASAAPLSEGRPAAATQAAATTTNQRTPAAPDKPILGIDGKDPAGYLKCEADGLYWIVYRTRPKPIELEAAKFEEYLRAEGLERIIDIRKQRGDSEKPGREAYSRCAKSLLVAGDDARASYDAPVGLPLELVPEHNPAALKPGDELAVRVVLDGKPLEGVRINARAKADPTKVLSARSDKDGRVKLALPHEGMWLITAVHMREAAKGIDADWESLWASMTFELRK